MKAESATLIINEIVNDLSENERKRFHKLNNHLPINKKKEVRKSPIQEEFSELKNRAYFRDMFDKNRLKNHNPKATELA